MLLGGQDVLVHAADGAVHDDEMRLVLLTDLGRDLAQANVLVIDFGTDPTAVEPNRIDVTVVRAEFLELVVDELHIFLPALGVFLRVVAGITGRDRTSVLGPEVFAVPVRLGEVGGYCHPLIAESPDQFTEDIRTRILSKRILRIRDLVV